MAHIFSDEGDTVVETSLSGLTPIRRMVYLEWDTVGRKLRDFAGERQTVVLYLNDAYLNSFKRG